MREPEMETLILVVYPTGAGKYSWFIRGKLVIESSRQPFLDAARRLLSSGVSADAFLIMRHVRSHTDSFKAKIGEAAKLTVQEGEELGPRFARWKPFDPECFESRAIETIDNSSKANA
jgi:hypothetical protein